MELFLPKEIGKHPYVFWRIGISGDVVGRLKNLILAMQSISAAWHSKEFLMSILVGQSYLGLFSFLMNILFHFFQLPTWISLYLLLADANTS